VGIEGPHGRADGVREAQAAEAATPEQLAMLQAILNRPEFQAAEGRGLLDRLLDPLRPVVRWLLGQLFRLFVEGLKAGGEAVPIGLALVSLAVVGVAVVVVRRAVRGTLAGDAALGTSRQGGPPRATDELAAARAFAAAGDARRAVHHHYLAIQLRLDERDHLPFDGALTNRELVPRLDAAPELADPFAALVTMFDRLWYGQASCSLGEYDAFARLAERVWAAAEAHPPRQPVNPRRRSLGVPATRP
jgi:hypothetical protein